jgi:SagB-type dehydrogenase family enzyme
MDRADDALADERNNILFELYHENSKQRRHDIEFNRRINLLNNNADFHQVMARTFKFYPGAAFTPLPAVEPGEGPPFERVVALRRSIRRFSGASLRLDALARLVYFGNGLSGQLDASSHGIVQPVRAAPSGGALYPVEIYAAVMAVEGLEPGLYHYAVDRHGLEFLRPGRWEGVLSEITFDSATFSRAAVAFILTGMFGRAHFKYGERGYRFTLLEAGHICQNILLAATAQELGAVAVGGFIDDEMNELLDLDGVDEAAVYLVAAGHPALRPAPQEEGPGEIVDKLLGELYSRETASEERE